MQVARWLVAVLVVAACAPAVGCAGASAEEKTNSPAAATTPRNDPTAVPSAPSATASRIVPQVGPITPRRVSFAPAGPPRLAVVESDGTVSVWLLEQPAEPRCFSWIRTDAMDAVFSADGKRLVTAGRDGALSMWTADGSPVRRVAAHTGPVRALAVAGDLIVSGGTDGELRLWTADLAPRGEPFAAHKGGVLSVAVSKQRDIASFGVDQMLRIWSARSGAAYRERVSLGLGRPGFSQQLSNLIVIDPRWGWGRQVAYAAKDDLLAVAPFDAKLRLLHKDGKPVAEMPQAHEGQQVQTVAFVGPRMLSAGFDRKLRFWKPDGQSAGPAVEAHGAAVVGLDVSPDGALIASTGTDDAVHLSDATGKPVAELPLRSKDRIRSIAVSADGKLVAAGNSAGEVWLWSRAAAVQSSPIKAAEKGVAAVALSRRNDLVASNCGRGDAVCIWTADGLPVVGPLTGFGYEIPNVAFSADGRFLAHGHNYATKVLVRSTDRGETRAQLEGLKAETTAVAFFPDGETIAAASTALRFWKLDGSWVSNEMLPKSGIMFAIAISPGGDRIASAGLDGLIYLWKPDGSPDGEPMAGHAGRVSALSFTAEGRLLSGGEDGKLRIWNLEKRQPRIVNGGAPIVAVGSAGKLDWVATRRWEVHFYGNDDALRVTLSVEPSGALVTAADGSYSGQGEILQKLRGFDAKGADARPSGASERRVEAAFDAGPDAAPATPGGATP
jgi:WD40 repeat protein